MSSANANESYDDIMGVTVESLMLRDEQIQKYLDGSFARGEIPKRLTVGGHVRFLHAAQLEVSREIDFEFVSHSILRSLR